MKDKSMSDLEDIITSPEMAARVRNALEDTITHIDILTGAIHQLEEVGAANGDESPIIGGRCIAAKGQIVKAVISLLEDTITHIDILTGAIRRLEEVGAVDGDESLIIGGRCIAAKGQIVKAVTSLLEEAA